MDILVGWDEKLDGLSEMMVLVVFVFAKPNTIVFQNVITSGRGELMGSM